MPRSPTILTPPPGILPFVPNTTIRSQDANALFNDLYQDGNTPRPIAYGGTGANNALDALNNLGAISQSNLLRAFSIGDGYYSVRDISSVNGVWLKRDGALYDSSTYPELASLLPPLPDGVEWSQRLSVSGGVRKLYSTASTSYAAVYTSNTSSIYTSADGDEWSLVDSIDSFIFSDMTYGGGVFVAVDAGGYGSVSLDGINWGSAFPISVGQTFNSIAYGNGIFVAVGLPGIIFTSADGTSWTSRTSGTSANLKSVIYVNSTFVVVGNGGTILTSTDGIAWTARTSGISSDLNGVSYGNSLYVAVGSSGVILSSPNLTTWTPRSSGVASNLNAVTYSSSGFMAVGSSGIVRLSSNGTSWGASPTGVSGNLLTVSYDPDRQEVYFVGGSSGTSTILMKGVRTLPTQFRVPNDSPQYGWIKAESD
jgi:hypothetical protein